MAPTKEVPSELTIMGFALCNYLRTGCVQNVKNHHIYSNYKNFQGPNGKSPSSQCYASSAHTLLVRISDQLGSCGVRSPGPKQKDSRAEFPTPELEEMFANLAALLPGPIGQLLLQTL